ncbi:MAG: glycosyltransferase family 2 protein [Clostridia bacterium]|nr:glycosyltransferase family 2 protein [Clostridia bacterium]
MFFISTALATLCLICSIFININWINDIACSFGYFLAIYLVTFIALIPGFNFIFMFISLLHDKKEEKACTKKEKDVTVLIPVYNSKKYIEETIKSIKKQKYCGDIHINIIDDGSTDGSLELLKSMEADSAITLIESNHMGKASALNKGLEHVKTDYTITVDSDTILHPLAIRNIMSTLVNSDKKTAATAGCLFVKNAKKSFVTKLQEWDYSLGIFGVKLIQGNYNSTLVAQGAFSAYKTKQLKEIGGWQNCVGEDIVLTWELLSRGYTTNFSKNAIAFTEVPEKLSGLGKQRKRWARGMIEAFKKVKVLTSKDLNFKSKFLMLLNVFFLFIDLALLIFVPLGLILLALGSQLLIGWMSLFVLLFGMLLCLLIEIRRKNMLKDIECKLEKRSFLAFIVYVLLYAFILAPYCLIGYISELLNSKKEW